jgi:hypothetical protein
MDKNKVYLDGSVCYLLACEVPVHFEVFGFIMKNWIFADFNTALVVTLDSGGLPITKTEFLY